MIRYFLIIFFGAACFVSCKTKDASGGEEQKYQQAKISIVDLEKSKPGKFLHASADVKKNLIGKTVVKGQLTSQAKMVSFGKIELEFRFFDEAGIELERDTETLDDDIAPGETISFKTKFFTPKGTESVKIIVLSAEGTE